MIELKLSQGAKPGHGGILPARKNTKEISTIRGTIPGMDVLSPPYHQAFNTPIELIKFIGKLQKLAHGKPVGFKMCVGTRYEFIAIAKAMVKTKIFPDFIAIDGGEGGTGAAPLEFSNSVGMPFKEGLAYAYNVLDGFDIKQHIRLLASGKILSGFDIFRAIALGADGTYSARAMMMATGCIQALVCNQNTCPTGVATQDPELVAGLVVSDKKVRVANYHKETVESFVELMAATGIDHPDKINRHHIFRRLNQSESTSYASIYPYISTGCLLDKNTVPLHMLQDYELANPNSFTSTFPTNN